MSREKVVSFPARTSPELQDIRLWFISLGAHKEECTFSYDEGLNGWIVRVNANSFVAASRLICECQKLLGMSDFSAWEVKV